MRVEFADSAMFFFLRAENMQEIAVLRKFAAADVPLTAWDRPLLASDAPTAVLAVGRERPKTVM